MLKRVAVLILVAAIVAAMPGGPRADCADGDDDFLEGLDEAVIFSGIFLSGFSFALTMHNRDRLESDNPSIAGGTAGLLLGSALTAYGSTCLFTGDTEIQAAGAGFAAMGAITVYYGVRSLGAVRRKNIEMEEQGLMIDPVLMADGEGMTTAGIQVRWSF